MEDLRAVTDKELLKVLKKYEDTNISVQELSEIIGYIEKIKRYKVIKEID